jgi:small subunit ribosomal protein S3
MARSLKKGPFLENCLVKKVKHRTEKHGMIVWSRSSTIIPTIIGYTIGVYNGRDHIPVFITDQIVGHKLGEFSPTRTFRGHLKSNKKMGLLYLYLVIMGQKSNPIGLRLGITQTSKSHWYAVGYDYAFFVREDHFIRNFLRKTRRHCMISRIEIERFGASTRVRISAAQVMTMVGPKGDNIKRFHTELRNKLQSFRRSYSLTTSLRPYSGEMQRPEIHIFVRQLVNPEADSICLASFIVTELEIRASFRRTLYSAQKRTRSFHHVRGLRIQISGRLNGADIARTEWVNKGRVPLSTLSADLDFSSITASTIYGLLGVKVWIFRPDVFLLFHFYVES